MGIPKRFKMKPTHLVFLFIIHLWRISSKKHYIIEVADNEDLANSSKHEEVSDEVVEDNFSDEAAEEEVSDVIAEEVVSDEVPEEVVSDEVPEEEASDETRTERVGGDDYWYWRRMRGGRRG